MGNHSGSAIDHKEKLEMFTKN
jgi:hypothetical protein